MNCQIQVSESKGALKQVNEYVFVKSLGQGSFASVKLAKSSLDNTEYVISRISERLDSRFAPHVSVSAGAENFQ